MLFFFFNDTATTEIYTLSLHDALPISAATEQPLDRIEQAGLRREFLIFGQLQLSDHAQDRKSTRLNSSHSQISYAVFCLKKKKITNSHQRCTMFCEMTTGLCLLKQY